MRIFMGDKRPDWWYWAALALAAVCVAVSAAVAWAHPHEWPIGNEGEVVDVALPRYHQTQFQPDDAAAMRERPSALIDPCVVPWPTTKADKARCWIAAAYEVLGGPPDEADLAFAVAAAESGFRVGVKNRRSSATGLFQFIKSTWRNVIKAGPDFMREWTIEDRKDGWRNALAAVWLAGRDRWRTHWQVCSNFTGPGSGPVRCGAAGGWLR